LLYSLLKGSGAYRIYQRYLRNQIGKYDKPRHIGIILDGNRRWASNKEFPRFVGHKVGADRAEALLDWCHDIGIKTITLYVLSTENLERPPEELRDLLNLIQERLERLFSDERIYKYRVRVKALGEVNLLPKEIKDVLSRIEEATKDFDGHFLNIAIAYTGRNEIVESIKKIVQDVQKGNLKPDEIDSSIIESKLYTSHLPDPEPDLIIRTSGEERLSGFLLWQSAYSELVFLDVYWPDFRLIDLMRAIRTFQRRQRRFGK
jgi:tritrans,polycis-undecaprenyl-diphosphate synthase [geranylgeranyl-diphosphate specific]